LVQIKGETHYEAISPAIPFQFQDKQSFDIHVLHLLSDKTRIQQKISGLMTLIRVSTISGKPSAEAEETARRYVLKFEVYSKDH
jgi:hypothetical protein